MSFKILKTDRQVPTYIMEKTKAAQNRYSIEKTEHLRNKVVCIKVGGNALTDQQVKTNIILQIYELVQLGVKPVLIHGGGIEIKQLLDEVGIESEFIGGHRKTDLLSIKYIEMALSGLVNKELVSLLNRAGLKAVGISGKDGGLIKAIKRTHIEIVNSKEIISDLGFVGDVSEIDPSVIHTLLDAGFLPVVSPVSSGSNGETFNINADMFAGHLAGALKAENFVALTNIDGLLEDLDKPDSLIDSLTIESAKKLFGTVIQGGMIPKIESCFIALENGVKSAHIINGTKNHTLLRILLSMDKIGTTISR